MFRNWVAGRRKVLLVLLIAVVGAVVPSMVLGSAKPMRPLAVNQTDGFGNGKLVAFTYSQQFHCIHEPFDNLDGPGHTGDGAATPDGPFGGVAAVDPDEFQTGKCIVGPTASGSLPTIDPTGRPIAGSEPLFVLVPFFDADGDGTVDALDPTPGLDVQCPEPGAPFTEHTGAFGTCTMHPTTLHLEPVASVIEGLLGLPAGSVTDTPLVNHSHLIRGVNFGSIWWQVIVVLVFDENIWPSVTGACPANAAGKAPCLTSLNALRDAQEATPAMASGDVPTNFFLFFDSRLLRSP